MFAAGNHFPTLTIFIPDIPRITYCSTDLTLQYFHLIYTRAAERQQNHITTKQLTVMKRKIETLPVVRNLDNANQNHSSEKRRQRERAESPREEDRLFVTPDPEDPHRYTYCQQEVIESEKHVRQNRGINESNTDTTQEQSSNVQKTLNMAQLLALPAGLIAAPIASQRGKPC